MFAKKGDAAVLAKFRDAPAQYREIAQHLHRVVRENAPSLEPLVRWGIAFYARDGEDVCYIKFGENFLVFGFGEALNPARHEGANLHPVVWNVTGWDDETEARIAELVKEVAP